MSRKEIFKANTSIKSIVSSEFRVYFLDFEIQR